MVSFKERENLAGYGLYVMQPTESLAEKIKNTLSFHSLSIDMYLSRQKKWLFGSFMLAAPNSHAARRAYELLIDQHEEHSPTGILKFETGEIILWTRFPLD